MDEHGSLKADNVNHVATSKHRFPERFVLPRVIAVEDEFIQPVVEHLRLARCVWVSCMELVPAIFDDNNG